MNIDADPQFTLPGGYKIGDVVYSLIKLNHETEPIDVGSKGTVQGPCSDTSAADFDQRVSVDFGDGTGGQWNLPVASISKTDPTKVRSIFTQHPPFEHTQTHAEHPHTTCIRATWA